MKDARSFLVAFQLAPAAVLFIIDEQTKLNSAANWRKGYIVATSSFSLCFSTACSTRVRLLSASALSKNLRSTDHLSYLLLFFPPSLKELNNCLTNIRESNVFPFTCTTSFWNICRFICGMPLSNFHKRAFEYVCYIIYHSVFVENFYSNKYDFKRREKLYGETCQTPYVLWAAAKSINLQCIQVLRMSVNASVGYWDFDLVILVFQMSLVRGKWSLITTSSTELL